MKTLKKVSKLQQQITLSIPLLCALQSASALGLGEISVNSSLNQPLSVSVPIFLSAGENASPDQIIAGLANAAEHNRAGLPYASILKDLNFNITRSPGGQLIMNINSRRSLYEPIINFLVDVSWGKGHLVKEVSIFLDPANFQPVARTEPAPVVSRAAPVAVTRQTLESSAETRVAPPVATRERRRPVKRKPIVVENGNYTVQRGDSLSRIAKAVSKQSDLSMQEAMQIIYELNPGAFMGSMDRLKANVELIIPDMTVATEVVTERVTPAPAPAPAPKPVVEAKPEPITAPEIVAVPTDTPRLEILPPEELTTPAETTSVATESVDTKTAPPSAITDSPDAAVVQQIANAQVAEMQSQLAEIEGENSKLELALNDTRSELEATHTAMTEMREEMKSLLEIQKNQATNGPVPVKSWIDWIPWMLTALAFSLLALFGFRRSKPAPAALAEVNYTSAPSPREIASMAEAEIDHPDTSLSQAQPAARSLLDDVGIMADDTILNEDDSTQVVPPTALMEAELTSDEPASELDSVQEAEIYLAYHQYSLAEKTIDRLLNDDPDSHIYKLLKLRLLAETGKMNEMQSLSIDLFRQFPDRDDETHQKIQSICDKAFTSTDTSDTVATSILSATAQTEVINPPDDSDPTSETVIHEDMTDFMTDATHSDTQPAIDLEHSLSREALEADTISVEDQDLTLPEYKQASDDINFIAEDLTEEGLDLPFDLETEILEEEARRIASDHKDRDKKDS